MFNLQRYNNELQNIKINEEDEGCSDKDYKPHGIQAKMDSGSYKRVPKMERKEPKPVCVQEILPSNQILSLQTFCYIRVISLLRTYQFKLYPCITLYC